MTVRKFVYISGPRMGTNNEKSNGPLVKSSKKKRRKKRNK